MKFYGKAEEAANDILDAFKNPHSLPKPLATMFIKRKDGVPSRSWSWRNQLIALLRGHSDARGIRQWNEVGRLVKKGESAFYILAPLTKKQSKDEAKKDEEGRVFVYGFKGVPVFGYGQTEGKPLPVTDSESDAWRQSLPLIGVAESWGIRVEATNGNAGGPLGSYSRQGEKVIALGVKNLATWTHELVHAADHRNGKLKELGQHWRSETVAELGGAVLLRILGEEHEADLGGCWKYIKSYPEAEGIEAIDACGLVLERVCEAVALILDAAESIVSEKEAMMS
jgi:hypothetical protein